MSVRTDVETILLDSVAFFAYMNSTQSMSFADDATGRYLDVNNAFLGLLGYTRDEVVGKTSVELGLYEDRGEREKALDLLRHCGTLNDYPVMIKSKSGETKFGRISSVLLDMYEIKIRFTIMKDETDRVMYEQKLSQLFNQAISAISKVSELRDAYTAGHQKKVEQLACAIAAEMGLPDSSIKNIATGALLHDIGKIYIASEILNKPSKLSEIEMKMVQSHPQLGYEVAKEIDIPPEIPTMIYQHHERLDGSGYPDGIKGPDIILESRILAVADVVAAMSSHRPYRPALKCEAILDEITRNKHIKYDGAVVDACLRVMERKSPANT